MAYNVLQNVHLVNAVSMGASITSAAQRVLEQDNIGIQLVWTGSPVGAFTVQVSINHKGLPQEDPAVDGTWTNLPLSTPVAAAGGADSAYIDLNQLSAPFYRVVYARTSGSGTLDVYVSQKGV